MEFFKIPARHLHNHIIECGLKKGRGGFGNLVFEFVEGVSDGQFCRYLGNRIAGGFGGQCRRARYPRVHFNSNKLFVFRILCELHVAPSCKVAQCAHDFYCLVAHVLIGSVRKCHGRCDGDGVAGVYAHRVEVLYSTYHHYIVVLVAEQFKFEFFPAQNGFFYEYLVGGRSIQAAFERLIKFFLLHDKAAAGTTKGV